jgi:cell division protein FtsA
MALGRNGVVAALDVGSSKVSCFIARIDGRGAIRVIGIGHHESKGVRAGAVVDMDTAERSIRAAVDGAEHLAGQTVDSVIVTSAGGHLASHTVGIEVGVAGRQIADYDVNRGLAEARAHIEPGEREVVHAVPIHFSVDDSHGIRDPRGMYATRLGVNLHIVTAATGVVRNLTACVGRGDLAIERQVVAPYAAGLASLVQDELDLGVVLLDMGGGTTSIGVFGGGQLVYADSVPVGGHHITQDIARGLGTPLNHAERMKTLYGSALPSATDDRDVMEIPQVGEDEGAAQVPRSALTGIIQPRVEETLEYVRDKLEASGAARAAGRRVVLVGGASQLQGMREFAGRILNKQVRMGRPLGLSGLAEATSGPAFAACAGVLTYVARTPGEAMALPAEAVANGRFGRVGRWLRANF